MSKHPDMELTQPGVDVWRPQQAARSLLVYHHDGANLVPLAPGVPIVLGRGNAADIVCRGVRLSRRHARFQLMDDKVLVQDLFSTNGTFVNGMPAQGPTMCSVGDEIGLGSVVVTVTSLNPAEGEKKGIEGHDRFMERLRDEVTRAATFGRSMAIVMIRELDQESPHLHRWGGVVRDKARTGVDRVGLYEPRQIGVVLAEGTRDSAVSFCKEVLQSVDNDKTLLAFGVAVYPEEGRSADRLVAGANRAVIKASFDHPLVFAGRTQGVVQQLQADHDEDVVVRSPAMKEVYARVGQVAPAIVPVLILGETGTGKELVARALHERSQRADKPMLTINCGGVAPTLLESTLFGHEKGAFTGANRMQRGVFESADGGTVFLDEIGELPLPAQAALLRVLDTNKVVRLGSSRELDVDVRIIAATNRNLDEMVEAKTFRLDLLHRINMIALRLPPLRERLSEIIPLSQHFMLAAAQRHQRPVRRIDPEALQLLMKYHWPGNVRELRNVIERAVLIALGDAITPDDLPQAIREGTLMRLGGSRPRRARPAEQPARPAKAQSPAAPEYPAYDDDEEEDVEDDETQSMHAPRPYKAVMLECEYALISAALRKHNGNLTDVATALGMPRRTLAYKVKTQEIHAQKRVGAVETLTRWSNATEKHGTFKERMEQVEARLITSALAAVQGDVTRAAEILEIDRRTLVSKMERHGFDPDA